MTKILTLIILILIVSCKSTDNIWIYKDTNLVDKPISNTINNFTWNNDTLGERDSISIKSKKELFQIIKSIKKQKGIDENINFSPDYAFVLKYNNINDTLYFDYDFNYGFFVENDSLIIDKNKKIKKHLLKNKKFKVFMEKDFFYYEQKFYKRDN